MLTGIQTVWSVDDEADKDDGGEEDDLASLACCCCMALIDSSKCARACAPGALSKADPRWDRNCFNGSRDTL